MAVVRLSVRGGALALAGFMLTLAVWAAGGESWEDQASNLAAIAVWALFFTSFSAIPFDDTMYKGENFSFKCCAVSSMQQVIMILVTGLMLVSSRLASASEEHATLYSWMASTSGPAMPLMRQIHCCLIGAMFKDFWMPDELHWTFVFHHMIAITGCSICLVVPVGFAAAAANAAQAEATSLTFNSLWTVPVLMEGRVGKEVLVSIVKIVYVVCMMCSHVFGAWVGVLFAFYFPSPPTDVWWTWWRAMYVGLCALLVVFRISGQYIYQRKIYEPGFEVKLAKHSE